MDRKPHQTGCRICGNTKIESRGLCSRHYRRFLAKIEALGEFEAKEFERLCLEQGWVTERSKGGRPKDRDPLDELADLVKDGTRQAAEARARYESKTPTKTNKDAKDQRNTG